MRASEKNSSPVEVIPAGSGRRILLICDHASNEVPPDLHGLGLAERYLQQHIALDIGAAEVTRGLATRLGAAAVLARYSRLVLDCNRHPEAPDLIPEVSDGVIIPGNAKLSPAEQALRIERFHTPFHAAIKAEVERLDQPVILSIHSYTPVMKGVPRPWQAGILWNQDERLARRLIDALSSEAGMLIGDNEPYSGRSLYYTLDTHAGARGLLHAGIEIRQDLISSPEGVAHWVKRLAAILEKILTA
jgi:predicted N-formylglutamate amidohydrolase